MRENTSIDTTNVATYPMGTKIERAIVSCRSAAGGNLRHKARTPFHRLPPATAKGPFALRLRATATLRQRFFFSPDSTRPLTRVHLAAE
ncbi:hypothetical protein L1887_42472 [Cichorium endivia]|nr:hypothetical protein L1887_42472 [Cichorium endivia]